MEIEILDDKGEWMNVKDSMTVYPIKMELKTIVYMVTTSSSHGVGDKLVGIFTDKSIDALRETFEAKWYNIKEIELDKKLV